MEACAIDHVNLSIPIDGIDEAVSFYRDLLGFELDGLDAYRAGERSLIPFKGDDGAIYLKPDADFDPPSRNFNHMAVKIGADEGTLRQAIDDSSTVIERERERPDLPGADVAIYVRDPFGYTVELRPGEC